MMKSYLVIAWFGAGIFMGVCNAACFFQGSVDGDAGGCSHEGELHNYGSSWTSKECLNCNCHYDGAMTCCSNFGRPVNYNKVKCEAIFDKEACVYTVVRKDNPQKTCKHAMVG
ncbi:beta-microseminoprotein-like [Ranitomeya variabilis]|uniref:beta-microseminoprotein-like n=1 Tax=Ranitomeya variabilis TaxID=490064 RepID=UPI00405765C9